MALDSKLFVTKIFLDRDHIDSFEEYPFNIPVVKNFESITLKSPVTFLIGENGIGKSTFIEAIAVSLGLNPEGGSQHFNFKTRETHSSLSDFLHVQTFNKPSTKFFLRAESFYNVASEVVRIEEESHSGLYDAYGGNPHECSHGESFIKLVQNRFFPNGLYILDEPEAALSPQRQMSLLCLINDLVEKGSQFIIATHSPILISYRKGVILDLDNDFKETAYQYTEIYHLYKMYLDDPDGMQSRLFD